MWMTEAGCWYETCAPWFETCFFPRAGHAAPCFARAALSIVSNERLTETCQITNARVVASVLASEKPLHATE
jgi:hypothetical protein